MPGEPGGPAPSSPPRPRVAVVFPDRDPLNPYRWSGTPAGLAAGLAECGFEVVPLGAGLPPGLHHAVALGSRAGGKRGAVADRTVIRQVSRTWALGRAVGRARPLDLVVAMNTERFDLATLRRAGAPIATYDDATLHQMWQHPDSDTRAAGFPPREVEKWVERHGRSSRAADVVCTSTSWAARSFVDDYGVAADRVHVVGIGHRPRPSTTERDWSRPRFLFVGVDWVRKNGEAVLRAFREVRTHTPEATLHVVGASPEVDEPGVVIHGLLRRQVPAEQATLDKLYTHATAFVLPSRYEPAGIVYLEAASAGLPVVATSVGGASELLAGAAMVVDPDDGPALAAAMSSLCDPGTARARGEAARVAAAQSTWPAVAGRLVQAVGLSAPARQGDGRAATSS